MLYIIVIFWMLARKSIVLGREMGGLSINNVVERIHLIRPLILQIAQEKVHNYAKTIIIIHKIIIP